MRVSTARNENPKVLRGEHLPSGQEAWNYFEQGEQKIIILEPF